MIFSLFLVRSSDSIFTNLLTILTVLTVLRISGTVISWHCLLSLTTFLGADHLPKPFCTHLKTVTDTVLKNSLFLRQLSNCQCGKTLVEQKEPATFRQRGRHSCNCHFSAFLQSSYISAVKIFGDRRRKFLGLPK